VRSIHHIRTIVIVNYHIRKILMGYYRIRTIVIGYYRIGTIVIGYYHIRTIVIGYYLVWKVCKVEIRDEYGNLTPVEASAVEIKAGGGLSTVTLRAIATGQYEATYVPRNAGLLTLSNAD
jgi:hypothetical protein